MRSFIPISLILILSAGFGSCKKCFTCTRPNICAACGDSSVTNICSSGYPDNVKFKAAVDTMEVNGSRCDLTLNGRLEEEFCISQPLPHPSETKLTLEALEFDCF